ncbi:hypothetical protein V8F33_005733 [Rhypophila sp. PSN 637]
MNDEDDQQNKNSIPLGTLPPAGPAPQPTLAPLPESSPRRNSLENEGVVRQSPFDDLFVIGDDDSDSEEEASPKQSPLDASVGNPFADPDFDDVLFDSDAQLAMEDGGLPNPDAFVVGESDDESLDVSDDEAHDELPAANQPHTQSPEVYSTQPNTPLGDLGYENADDIPDMEDVDDVPDNGDADSNLPDTMNTEDLAKMDYMEAMPARTSLQHETPECHNTDDISDVDEGRDNVADIDEDTYSNQYTPPAMLLEEVDTDSPSNYSDDQDDKESESDYKPLGNFNRLDECPINFSPANDMENTSADIDKNLDGLADANDGIFVAYDQPEKWYVPCSTPKNGQEPFPQFFAKVELLIVGLFPDEDPRTIELERMRGGTYNRVVGVTLTDKNKRYVLRVPRTKKDEQLSRIAQIDITEDIAPLLFVKAAGIPCAEIISFQRDPINALRLPYMIQSRVKGECMLQPVCTGSLIHAQRRRVAKDMGQIYNKMLRTTSTVPGRIILPAGEISSTPTAEDILLAPYGSQESRPWKHLAEANAAAQPYNPGPVTERRNTHIAEFLFALIEDRKRATPAHNKNHFFIYNKWDEWVAKMQDKGLFDDMDYCLNHQDLWPRNIMVDVEASEEEPMITILDWDQAMFLPAFNMCIPPTWVWDLENCREPEQLDADADPIDPLKRELKLIFEENAGRNYVRYAKELDYKMGRIIVMRDILRGLT